MSTVLIADDDPVIRGLFARVLARDGFEVIEADDGEEVLARVHERSVDVVLLDSLMPVLDGPATLAQLRSDEATLMLPVILVTALGDEANRVHGLELGADDYLAKPAELRELVARIRSVIRRAGQAAPPAGTAREKVRFGTKWLDLEARLLQDDDGVDHPLTTSEFNLLKAFADHPRRVLSRERLLDLANARDPDAFDRAIDVRITRIRRKVEPDPNHPRIIRTIRGAGYVFSPDGQER